MTVATDTPVVPGVRLVAATVTYSRTNRRYEVEVAGEAVYVYDTPADHTVVVLFEDADSNWWWPHVLTAPDRAAAERLLREVADGHRGKAVVADLTSRD